MQTPPAATYRRPHASGPRAALLTGLQRIAWLALMLVHLPALTRSALAAMTGPADALGWFQLLWLGVALAFLAGKALDWRPLRLYRDGRTLLLLVSGMALFHVGLLLPELAPALTVQLTLPAAGAALLLLSLRDVQLRLSRLEDTGPTQQLAPVRVHAPHARPQRPTAWSAYLYRHTSRPPPA